jgi:hypothetical protein
MRVRVSYDGGGKRLHFHGVSEEVNGKFLDDVAYWHKADIKTVSAFVRYWSKSGHHDVDARNDLEITVVNEFGGDQNGFQVACGVNLR